MSNSAKKSDFSQLICFSFYKGWRVINNHYKNYLPEGVTPQQSYILESCHETEGTTVSNIAEQIETDQSAISNMLKRMEMSGLITREVQPTNRRKTNVYLTTEGIRLRDEIRALMTEADRVLTRTLNKQEKTSLTRIVNKLRELELKTKNESAG